MYGLIEYNFLESQEKNTIHREKTVKSYSKIQSATRRIPLGNHQENRSKRRRCSGEQIREVLRKRQERTPRQESPDRQGHDAETRENTRIQVFGGTVG